MAKLEKEQPVENTEIITLAYHVDYWDYLGWKDEFSLPKYGQRQSEYVRAFGLNSNYTPQMVIDGRKEFVGSRYSQAVMQIGEETANRKGEIKITLKKELLIPSLKINISELDTKEDSDVWLVISEDDLETDVKRGENSGKKLSHSSVVRDLQQIGYVAAGENAFETEKSVKLDKEWKEKNLNFIVFAQNKNSRYIVAIGKVKLK